jgi:hypothetical protein
LEVLEEIKKTNSTYSMKNLNNISSGQNNLTTNFMERRNEEKFDPMRQKFIRHVTKKSSKRITGLNLISSIFNQKLQEDTKLDLKPESSGLLYYEDTPRENNEGRNKFTKSEVDSTVTMFENNDETPRLMIISEKKNSSDKGGNEGLLYPEATSFGESVNNINSNLNGMDLHQNILQKNSKFLKLPIQKAKVSNGQAEILLPTTKKSAMSFTNFLKSFKLNTNQFMVLCR